MRIDYTYNDIINAYRKIGIQKGSTVLLKTDMRYLGNFESRKRDDILSAHFDALAELVDLNVGTIVVATSSTFLCNTDIPFDVKNTPSERGVFTDHIRKMKGTVRSFHPFVSHTAIGKNAEMICGNVSRQAYGPNTVKGRMLGLDTFYVSMGLPPNLSCSMVHYIEFVMGVPYRYVKEFIHPVVRNGKIVYEPFYLHVLYLDCDIKRDLNRKIFDNFREKGNIINEAVLGRGKIFSYSMHDFYNTTVKAFENDIYIWLKEPPTIRPYQK